MSLAWSTSTRILNFIVVVMEIYFDNAATTAIDPVVLEVMLPYLTRQYANPSSTHRPGREARQAVETARRTVADLLGALP